MDAVVQEVLEGKITLEFPEKKPKAAKRAAAEAEAEEEDEK